MASTIEETSMTTLQGSGRLKTVIVILIVLGIVFLAAGALIGFQWELKEEYSWQKADNGTAFIVSTITVYPLSQLGLVLAIVGGIIELLAAACQLLLLTATENKLLRS